jgi:hypothetical protein
MEMRWDVSFVGRLIWRFVRVHMICLHWDA